MLAFKPIQKRKLAAAFPPASRYSEACMIRPVATTEFASQSPRRKPEEFEFVKFSINNAVAHITLNRPEHNLLNEVMLREISDGITSAGESDDVKLLVVDSACKVFSGGIDIGEYTSQRVFQMLDAFHGAFAAMLDVGKPVLCVVKAPRSAAVPSSPPSAIWSSPLPKRASRSRKSPSAFFRHWLPQFCRSSSAPKPLSNWSSPAKQLPRNAPWTSA
jgi:hypothetical protein